jgi:radical SAM protein with 4Fe4S-binding SPASM domain
MSKKFEKNYLLKKSKYFCMLPWIHTHVLPSSEVIPCCVWPYNKSLGNVSNSSLKEIINNDEYKQIRKKMLSDESVENCRQCYQRDSADGMSLRTSSNSKWGHFFERDVLPTTDDVTITDFKMVYFDIRFSNICNFKCRGCSPELSSSWLSDHEKLYDYKSDKNKLISIMPNENIWSELLKLVPTIEEAYFAGGEPLIMDEHYLMLEEFIKAGRTDIRLSYNSNMSNLKFRDKLIVDYWKNFKNVYVGVSIDDFGPRGEYFRHGMSWDKVVENINFVRKECPHVYFSVNCTVSLFNVYYLPEIHQKLVNDKIISIGDLLLNLLIDPIEYRVQVLPREFREKIAKKLSDYVSKMLIQYKDKDPVGISRLIASFNSVINFALESDLEASHKDFFNRNIKLDAIRGEDFLKTYPELDFLYDPDNNKPFND